MRNIDKAKSNWGGAEQP